MMSAMYASRIHALSALLCRAPGLNLSQLLLCILSLCYAWPAVAGGPRPNQQHSGRPISLEQALKATVERHPSLQVQRWEIESARGSRKQASGQFDTLTQSSLALQRQETPQTQIQSSQTSGDELSTIPSSDTAYNLNVSKQFRNGISVGGFSTLDRTGNSLLAATPFSTSQVGTTLTFPLLRGRGTRAVAANELASSIEVASREWDLQHT